MSYIATRIAAFENHRGNPGQSADSLLRAFKDRNNLLELCQKVHAYAGLSRDEDHTDPDKQSLKDRADEMKARVARASGGSPVEAVAILIRLLNRKNNGPVGCACVRDKQRGWHRRAGIGAGGGGNTECISSLNC